MPYGPYRAVVERVVDVDTVHVVVPGRDEYAFGMIRIRGLRPRAVLRPSTEEGT